MNNHVGQYDDSQPCIKHGRPIGSKDKNPRIRMETKSKDGPTKYIENLKKVSNILNI